MKKEKIKEKIKNILLKEKIIGFAYIFGSFLKDEEFNDIDIGIYIFSKFYEPSKEIDFILEIGAKLEKEIKKHVDIVIINSVNPHLRFKIINGELLFTKDENLHDFMIDYYLREYWDENLFFHSLI